MNDADQIAKQLVDDVYTLLPPHLADEWRRLREAKRRAEDKMRMCVTGKNVLSFAASVFDKWRAAGAELEAFEATHGIGGGA